MLLIVFNIIAKDINFGLPKNLLASKLKSIFLLKCPRCHQGQFLAKKAYDFSAFTSVRKSCTVCHLNYRKEPSFYTGSMYIAYALGVALMLLITGLNFVLFSSFSFLRTFWAIFIVLTVLSPYLNALSKIIWANLFFHYDPNWKTKS